MDDEIGISGLSELRDTLLNRLPQALQGKASQAALDDTLQNDPGAFMAGTGMLATGNKQELA